MTKLNIYSRFGLTRYAIKEGLIHLRVQAPLSGRHAALSQELSPIFFPSDVAGGPSGPVITEDSELVRAVFKLFELGAANDGAIRAAFSVSTDGSVSSVSVSQALQASLKRAEEQAARIQAVK
jgi:hypothetical protein